MSEQYLIRLAKETKIPLEYFKNIYDKGYCVESWNDKNFLGQGMDLFKIKPNRKITRSIKYLAEKLGTKPYSLRMLFFKGYLISKNKNDESNASGLEANLTLEQKRQMFALSLADKLEDKYMRAWEKIE